MDRKHENVLQMRALAAQLRDHAAETSQEIFKCKLEAAAAELEEAARDSEAFQFVKLPEKGNGHGYER
jgi:hypothetical protein